MFRALALRRSKYNSLRIDCSTNLITIFVCLSFLPVSFFFYLLSLTVNKTIEEKMWKTKTNIVRTFFERFQCGLVVVSGTSPM